MATANPNARVPAWKRIGLKLKYAKDTTEENTPPVSNSSPNPREENPRNPGKRSAEDAALETPAKRVKSYSKPLGDVQGQGRNYGFGASQPSVDAATKTPKRIVFDEEGTPVQGKGGRAASLRKSVSFTPDTKVEDGFSASNFFKAWVNGGSSDENSTSEPSQPEPEQAASPSKDPRPEKKKKPKKSKSTLLPPEEVTKAASSPEKKSKSKSKKSSNDPKPNDEEVQTTASYLTYLTQFHTSKSTWKFNKKHQQNLLKNLFNIYRIPSQHNAAIVEYIAGLQGSARERVAKEAGEVLKGVGGEEAMEVGTAGERMEACCAALEERAEELENGDGSKEEKEEKRREVEKGKRAEAILKEAFNEETLLTAAFASPSQRSSEAAEQKTSTTTTSSATSPATEKPSQSQPDKKPQRRKRKSRTDVSSSSESSSSESESKSDSDGD